jgi:glycosyltransferase involved in cell wall biosynthesis
MADTINLLMLLYEPGPSGQGTHVLSLVEGLNRERYRIIVVCPTANVHTIERLWRAGVTVIPMPMSKIRNAFATCRLIQILRREKVEIIHIHSQEAGIWGRIAAWVARVPVVIYTPQTVDIRQKRFQALYYLIERLLATVTDMLISVNDGDRVRMIDKGVISPRKIMTVYNGIEVHNYPACVDVSRTKEDLGIPSEGPVIAQIGRLCAQKGPRYLLEAATLVLETRPETIFLMVGEGPLRAEIEDSAKELHLSGHLLLLGWRNDVAAIIACVDVVVLSSLWEGLPYTLLEAMASGKPVVATAVNGSKELIRDGQTGLLVPPADSRALADAVLTLLDSSEVAVEMGRRAREVVGKDFSLENMVGRVDELYERLASRHQAR